MIARKVLKLRKGEILPGSYEETDWTELSIEAVRIRLIEVLKFSIHHFILTMLKIWIISSNWVRKVDMVIKEKLMHVLHKNGHLPAGGKPSRFIKNIRDHKKQVSLAIEKEAGEDKKAE